LRPIGQRRVEMSSELNVPPEGFEALFDGKGFAGWRMSPRVREVWSVEQGVMRAPGPIHEWGADLATEREFQDFELLVDFMMPTKSDSGILFRGLIPDMGDFGQSEQFNLRSTAGMAHLESFYFMPKEARERLGITEANSPHVRYIDPEVGVWHTVRLTVVGKTVTAEYNGEVILDHFEYLEGVLTMGPAVIRFQKHILVNGDGLGENNGCPVELRNIFIKEIGPTE